MGAGRLTSESHPFIIEARRVLINHIAVDGNAPLRHVTHVMVLVVGLFVALDADTSTLINLHAFSVVVALICLFKIGAAFTFLVWTPREVILVLDLHAAVLDTVFLAVTLELRFALV